jgi:hypothetical protein
MSMDIGCEFSPTESIDAPIGWRVKAASDVLSA